MPLLQEGRRLRLRPGLRPGVPERPDLPVLQEVRQVLRLCLREGEVMADRPSAVAAAARIACFLHCDARPDAADLACFCDYARQQPRDVVAPAAVLTGPQVVLALSYFVVHGGAGSAFYPSWDDLLFFLEAYR